MRYIKLFENMDRQREEIESIFSEFLDERELVDGEYHSKCEIEVHDSYYNISIYKDHIVPDVANDSAAFDGLMKSYSDEIILFKKIKVALDRLDHFKYEWGFNNTDHEIYIKVYKPVELRLLDAFGIRNYRHISVDNNLMYKVFKSYNIVYNGFGQTRGTSGYYGSNDIIYLHLKNGIDNDSPIVGDLKSLRYPKDGGRAFKSVSLIHDNKTIKIEY